MCLFDSFFSYSWIQFLWSTFRVFFYLFFFAVECGNLTINGHTYELGISVLLLIIDVRYFDVIGVKMMIFVLLWCAFFFQINYFFIDELFIVRIEWGELINCQRVLMIITFFMSYYLKWCCAWTYRGKRSQFVSFIYIYILHIYNVICKLDVDDVDETAKHWI